MLRRLRIENLVLIRQADLEFGPGLNAVTGETGAGKTILAQAVGLLLGARGDSSFVGPDSNEAYVEAEFDLPHSLLDEEELASIADVRPSGEAEFVAARRVFADGRTRAYAWGRAVARDDLARVVERLVAMSGQFEQRRLARLSHHLDVLDAFLGDVQLRRREELARGWRELSAAQRGYDELEKAAADVHTRAEELRELVRATEGLEPETEQTLKDERERLRNLTNLWEAVRGAAELLAPESPDSSGAAELTARARAVLGPVERLAHELGAAGLELAELEAGLRDNASSLRTFLASLEAQPGRLEEVEAELEGIAVLKRRFGAAALADLLARSESACEELKPLDAGLDPVGEAEIRLKEAQTQVDQITASLSRARQKATEPFSEAVAQSLRELGMGEGEFRAELSPREAGPSGRDEVSFLVRPNPGLGFAPVVETASGGELSRIALALRTVAHASAGEPTIVFDEIDAGVGGQTAHAVASALTRLAEGVQVLTITHLPQIASAAATHLRVEKVPGDPTHTRIEGLSAAARTEELERMLGGSAFLELISQGQRA